MEAGEESESSFRKKTSRNSLNSAFTGSFGRENEYRKEVHSFCEEVNDTFRRYFHIFLLNKTLMWRAVSDYRLLDKSRRSSRLTSAMLGST